MSHEVRGVHPMVRGVGFEPTNPFGTGFLTLM
jgi:hypothetical protein